MYVRIKGMLKLVTNGRYKPNEQWKVVEDAIHEALNEENAAAYLNGLVVRYYDYNDDFSIEHSVFTDWKHTFQTVYPNGWKLHEVFQSYFEDFFSA